ncbi:hypothetical protein, partial [Pseudomonas aeruginosa]|uniref:hypothetical protein n=1 Tax=Pseudomonas aeruginosa TaxID=287 RepID=UPI0019556460
KQINLINRGDLKFIFLGYQKAEKYFFRTTINANKKITILKYSNYIEPISQQKMPSLSLP